MQGPALPFAIGYTFYLYYDVLSGFLDDVTVGLKIKCFQPSGSGHFRVPTFP